MAKSSKYVYFFGGGKTEGKTQMKVKDGQGNGISFSGRYG